MCIWDGTGARPWNFRAASLDHLALARASLVVDHIWWRLHLVRMRATGLLGSWTLEMQLSWRMMLELCELVELLLCWVWRARLMFHQIRLRGLLPRCQRGGTGFWIIEELLDEAQFWPRLWNLLMVCFECLFRAWNLLMCMGRVRGWQTSFFLLLINNHTQKLLVVHYLVWASFLLLWIMLISSSSFLNILRHLQCIYRRLYNILSGTRSNRSWPTLNRLLLLLACRYLFWWWLILLIHLFNYFYLLIGNLTLICEAIIYYESRFVNIQMMPGR